MEVKEVTKSRDPLPMGRFRQREQTNNEWLAILEKGTTFEEIQKPGFWAFVAVHLNVYDKIRVAIDDQLWYAELLVIACNRVSALVKPTLFVKLVEDDAELPQMTSDYTVKFRGPQHKWSVIDPKGNVVQDGFKTEAEAMSHLAAILK